MTVPFPLFEVDSPDLIPLNKPSLFTIKHIDLFIINIGYTSILFPIVALHNNPISLFYFSSFYNQFRHTLIIG